MFYYPSAGLNPKEKRGALYGALINAGVGALANSGTRDPWDALRGAATSGVNSYYGGLENINQAKNQQVYNERMLKNMEMSERAEQLARERFNYDKEQNKLSQELDKERFDYTKAKDQARLPIDQAYAEAAKSNARIAKRNEARSRRNEIFGRLGGLQAPGTPQAKPEVAPSGKLDEFNKLLSQKKEVESAMASGEMDENIGKGQIKQLDYVLRRFYPTEYGNLDLISGYEEQVQQALENDYSLEEILSKIKSLKGTK